MGRKRKRPPGSTAQPSPTKMSRLQSQLKTKLDGAQFRYLNEQLYTTTGEHALSMMQEDPQLFDIYHRGFAAQVSKWPANPVDGFITMLKGVKKPLKVADMGCGEAALAKALKSTKHTVHSFDLVESNEFITAADIAHVPLKDGEVDVVIFSLSLMGTNVKSFLIEARRILRKGGVLKIAEVKSRFEDDTLEKFEETLEMLGFKLLQKDEENVMFFLLTFKKVQDVKGEGKNTVWKERDLPNFKLKPCIYKRR